ncbi:MAG: helix-turn-helix transcriptional regulator [Clostridiales bacterium]|nr:helix-turn-helix transcriptional regulator [Clostridiales bacterium]
MSQLADLRIRANLTQEKVASELSIDRSTVAKWETGIASPKVGKLAPLSVLYGCSIDELYRSIESTKAV